MFGDHLFWKRLVVRVLVARAVVAQSAEHEEQQGDEKLVGALRLHDGVLMTLYVLHRRFREDGVEEVAEGSLVDAGDGGVMSSALATSTYLPPMMTSCSSTGLMSLVWPPRALNSSHDAP